MFQKMLSNPGPHLVYLQKPERRRDGYKTMKKLFLLPSLIILLIPAFVFAQSAKDTYKALKRIEAKVEVGIVYKEYMNILADAQLEVNLYSQSAEFANETNVISSMETILRHYKLAGMVWDSMITGSPPHPKPRRSLKLGCNITGERPPWNCCSYPNT